MAKRTMPSDSAHQIGLSTFSKDFLTVDEGVCGWRFKNCEIWYVFNYIDRTDRDTDKRTPPFDSAHQIGVSTFLKDVLTVDEGVCGWRFKNCEILYIFNYGARIRRGIVKQMVRLDSAHQIRLEIIFNGILKCISKVLFRWCCGPSILIWTDHHEN